MTAELTPQAVAALSPAPPPPASSPPPSPRRARQLIPRSLPRRGELIAGGAVALVLAHLLLAQLTLVLAIGFAVLGRATRWRAWWLLGPAVAGLAWVLAAGPDRALAGFAAAPAGILAHLGAARAARAGQQSGLFWGIAGLLPRQLPVALPLAAAEAALWSWLAWLHTDEWAVPAPRRGAVAALRAAVAVRTVRSGAVVTRDGCALGVVAATGAVAELRWAEIARGALVTGADEREVTLACLQVVHAALRRRKPLIVLADGRDTAIAGALAAACRATGTPLLPPDRRDASAARPGPVEPPEPVAPPGGPPPAAGAASASLLWGRDRAGFRPQGQRAPGQHPGTRPGPGAAVRPAGPGPVLRPGPGAHAESGPADLTPVIIARAAVLLGAGTPRLAARACADVAALAAHLRAIGVDGDALVWAPRAELLPGPALAALLRDGGAAGLPVLAGTTSPATATELCGRAGTILVRRVADPGLADALAARSGTRLLPPPVAAAPGGGTRPGAAAGSPPSRAPGAAPALAGEEAAGLVPSPVITARSLLALGEAEFVLSVHAPRPRHVAPGRLVPARLPPVAGLAGPAS